MLINPKPIEDPDFRGGLNSLESRGLKSVAAVFLEFETAVEDGFKYLSGIRNNSEEVYISVNIPDDLFYGEEVINSFYVQEGSNAVVMKTMTEEEEFKYYKIN